jgi:hypothetical protein
LHCRHIHKCAHAYTLTHTCAHTHSHTCAHTHSHTCAHTHTHTHIHTHTCTHTHTHTRTHALLPQPHLGHRHSRNTTLSVVSHVLVLHYCSCVIVALQTPPSTSPPSLTSWPKTPPQCAAPPQATAAGDQRSQEGQAQVGRWFALCQLICTGTKMVELSKLAQNVSS